MPFQSRKDEQNMKFYYQDKLIRTSKNHNYTHAVINTKTGACVGCRTSEQACQSLINSEVNRYYQGIENGHKAIDALEAGKAGYYSKDGRKSWYIKFDSRLTVEYYKEHIQVSRQSLKYISDNWKIVELECR